MMGENSTHFTNPLPYWYLSLGCVASQRAEQRLTHFVSLSNRAAMISLLAFCRYSSVNNSRGRPSICLAKHRTRILLPTRTRFVTPGSTELHFYSDRHVRDRVRLHLRRVTENNNRERRTRPTTTERNLRGSARHEQSRTLPRCDEESRRGAGPSELRRLPRQAPRVSSTLLRMRIENRNTRQTEPNCRICFVAFHYI